MLKRVPRTRQASPAPVQQRLGRAGELRVRQAQARPCVRPRASAVHAQRTRPAARSVLFAAAEEWERSPVRPWASAKYFTLLKWFKISGPNTPPFQYVNPNWVHILFGSAHVFCMTKFLAQTMISKVSKPNIQKPIEFPGGLVPFKTEPPLYTVIRNTHNLISIRTESHLYTYSMHQDSRLGLYHTVNPNKQTNKEYSLKFSHI